MKHSAKNNYKIHLNEIGSVRDYLWFRRVTRREKSVLYNRQCKMILAYASNDKEAPGPILCGEPCV